jgi:hypothetical protein
MIMNGAIIEKATIKECDVCDEKESQWKHDTVVRKDFESWKEKREAFHECWPRGIRPQIIVSTLTHADFCATHAIGAGKLSLGWRKIDERDRSLRCATFGVKWNTNLENNLEFTHHHRGEMSRVDVDNPELVSSRTCARNMEMGSRTSCS